MTSTEELLTLPHATIHVRGGLLSVEIRDDDGQVFKGEVYMREKGIQYAYSSTSRLEYAAARALDARKRYRNAERLRLAEEAERKRIEAATCAECGTTTIQVSTATTG